MNDTLMTAADVAEYVGCSVNQLAQLRMRRQGPPYFKHGKMVRYRRADVENWINENMRCPAAD